MLFSYLIHYELFLVILVQADITTYFITVDVLMFQTLLVHQKCLDKQPRPRSDCFLEKQSDQGLLCLLLWQAFQWTNKKGIRIQNFKNI